MKNRFLIKSFAMATVVGTLLGTTGLTAFAAEATETKIETTKQALNPTVVAQVFDAEYYAKTNQDVVDVLGNDPAVLLQHYMVAGIYEGRDASATFNADAYLSANGDLASFYGDNLEGAIEHYIQFGINENRIATVSDAVKAGVTVKSVTNPDAVIAAPVAKKGASGVVVSGGGSGSTGGSESSRPAGFGINSPGADSRTEDEKHAEWRAETDQFIADTIRKNSGEAAYQNYLADQAAEAKKDAEFDAVAKAYFAGEIELPVYNPETQTSTYQGETYDASNVPVVTVETIE